MQLLLLPCLTISTYIYIPTQRGLVLPCQATAFSLMFGFVDRWPVHLWSTWHLEMLSIDRPVNLSLNLYTAHSTRFFPFKKSDWPWTAHVPLPNEWVRRVAKTFATLLLTPHCPSVEMQPQSTRACCHTFSHSKHEMEERGACKVCSKFWYSIYLLTNSCPDQIPSISIAKYGNGLHQSCVAYCSRMRLLIS